MTELTRDDLPQAIRHYLEHRRDDGYDPAVDFAKEAVVTDDGKTYAGLAEVAAWVSSAESEFTYTTTFLRAEASGDRVTVVNRLEGDFPGALVDLHYRFALDPVGRIEGLVIEV